MKSLFTSFIQYVFFCLLISFFIFDCTKDIQVAGNSGQVGNPSLTGIVFNSNGSKAKQAHIILIPADYNPQTMTGTARIDSTTTNDSGTWKFDTLPAGSFNLMVSQNGSLAKVDSIRVKTDTSTTAPACTLKAPGSVKGIVQLQPTDDARSVFIIFLGTNIIRTPDDSIGNFILTNLAEGKYRVRLLSTLDTYRPMDTSFTIISGKDSVLPEPLKLEYTGIPIPLGLKAVYDTNLQIVTLSWNNPASGRQIIGFNVYRKDTDSTTFALIKSGLHDTIFSDSSGTQDKTYEYRVAAVDSNNNIGTMSTATLIAIQSLYALDFEFGSQDSLLNQHGICTIKDSIIIVADKQNSIIRKYSAADGSYLGRFGGIGSSLGYFNQVWDVAADNMNRIYTTELNEPRVQVFTLNGNIITSWQISSYSAPSIVSHDTVVYISYHSSNVLECYSSSGTLINKYYFPTSSSVGPWDVCCDNNGTIYAPIENKVFVINPLTSKVISISINLADSSDPRCIATTNNNIFIGYLFNGLVQVIDNSGLILERWGDVAGPFSSFSSMAISGDKICISEGDKGIIQVFKRIK